MEWRIDFGWVHPGAGCRWPELDSETTSDTSKRGRRARGALGWCTIFDCGHVWGAFFNLGGWRACCGARQFAGVRYSVDIRSGGEVGKHWEGGEGKENEA